MYAAEILEEIRDEIRFHRTEGRFAVLCEIVGDLHTDFALDFNVGVGERKPHHVCDFLAYARFAGAHHADDDDAGR